VTEEYQLLLYKRKELIQRLDTLRYLGPFSFELFGPAVQKLPQDQLAAALAASFKYLGV
jgi:predicted xylose isomerase-like sugar epimerase